MIYVVLIVCVVVGVLVFAAFQPDSFRVQRSAVFKAPPEKVFAQINDFHQWRAWSPWEKLDPGLKRAYSGASSGKGAVYEWQGNSKIGQGRMEITESSAPGRIAIKLDFLKPFEAHNKGEFILAADGESTTVTWAMGGPSPYMTKLIHLFVSMDKMVGKSFEDGLANLKTIVEK